MYETLYWKEKCFAVSAEALVDLATDLKTCGGLCEGSNKASEFLCLTLKLLQIQPDKEIVVEFITNENHKYVRLLGAFYLRLIGKPMDVYRYLEPLLYDYRRIRYQNFRGVCEVKHVDELVNDLLIKDTFCDVTLPRLPRRQDLESTGNLMPKVTQLDLFKTQVGSSGAVDDLVANPIYSVAQENAAAHDDSKGYHLLDSRKEAAHSEGVPRKVRIAFCAPSISNKKSAAPVEIEPRSKKPRTKMQN